MTISKTWTRLALVAASAVLLNVLPVAADGLSVPPGHAGRRIYARRTERRACAHRRQENGATARAAVRDREPARRGRQYRRRRRRACRARRLHAADGQQQHPRHQRGLYKNLNYNPGKDFVPITLIGTQANILVVNPDVPAHSLKELIALAKAQPGKINFASSGYGAAAHLAGELFKSEAKINIVHVPYKGAAPALAGCDRRARADDVRDRRLGDRPHRGRAGARACRDDAQAHRDSAGHSDHGRGWPQGLRREHVAWPGRAGRHAAAGDRDAARCGGQGAARSGRARLRSASSASTSSATRRRNLRPTSTAKSRNGRRS